MKIAAVSELKAKLARYLRLIKAGEEVEIQERGVPIAVIRSIRKPIFLTIIPPRKRADLLGQLRFSVKPKMAFDIVNILIEDRRKR
jgi:prevent-host-death family protein